MDQILEFMPGTDRMDLGQIDSDTASAGEQAFGSPARRVGSAPIPGAIPGSSRARRTATSRPTSLSLSFQRADAPSDGDFLLPATVIPVKAEGHISVGEDSHRPLLGETGSRSGTKDRAESCHDLLE